MEQTRTCSRCGQEQPQSQWPPSGWLRGGWCRPCRNEAANLANEKRRKERKKQHREAGTKVCTKCGEDKPRGAFYFNARGHIMPACIECYRESHRTSYIPKTGATDDPRPCAQCGIIYQPRQRRPSKFCSRECGEAQRKQSGRERSTYLQRKYGITQERYDALLAAQRGGCALCGAHPSDRGRYRTYLHIDHDHATGMVRGLLCDRCNLLLGQLQDDPDRLASIVNYLNNPPAQRFG